MVAVREWERDQMHGDGEWDHPNGTNHKGEYKNGWPHGEGRAVKRNGDEEYIDTFVEGRMEGRRTRTVVSTREIGTSDGNGHPTVTSTRESFARA